MHLTKITFGTLAGDARRKQLQHDAAETYLAALLKNGQICGEYLFGQTEGTLVCYVRAPRPDAIDARHNSEWVDRSFDDLFQQFVKTPTVEILEEIVTQEYPAWENSTSLYLFTNAFDVQSPVCCGDSGRPVPLYLLPVTQKLRHDIFGWAISYRQVDHLWLGSGVLECEACRELTEPKSGLSKRGINLCRQIEAATIIPTFYFLLNAQGSRYFDEPRPCPQCGNEWHIDDTTDSLPGDQFHRFPFRCEGCRLVSHHAGSIGEEP